MTRLRWVCALVALTHLAGCASLLTPVATPADQIGSWLDQREFGHALALVADLRDAPSANVSDVREIEAKIQAEITRYERQVIADAERAAALQDWRAAFEWYREGLSRLPDSQALQRSAHDLKRRHADNLEQLEVDRAIAKGEWTLKDLEVRRLAEASNSRSWFGQWSLRRRLAGADELGRELAGYGRRALEREDLAMADRLIPLAARLSDISEIHALNAQLRHRHREEELRRLHERMKNAGVQVAEQRARAQEEKEQRSASARAESETAKSVMADLRRAWEEKNFVRARQLLATVEKREANGEELAQLRSTLTADIAEHVKRLVQLGVLRYGQQQYDEALSLWKRAHALNPDDDQLAARIKRATRVTQNLQRLRDRPATH